MRKLEFPPSALFLSLSQTFLLLPASSSYEKAETLSTDRERVIREWKKNDECSILKKSQTFSYRQSRSGSCSRHTLYLIKNSEPLAKENIIEKKNAYRRKFRIYSQGEWNPFILRRASRIFQLESTILSVPNAIAALWFFDDFENFILLTSKPLTIAHCRSHATPFTDFINGSI